MAAQHDQNEVGTAYRRLGRTLIGRRALLRGGVLGAAGLATAALIGCDDEDDEAPPAAATPTAATAQATPTAAPATATAAPATPTATPRPAPARATATVAPQATATPTQAATTAEDEAKRGGKMSWAQNTTAHLDIHQDSISGAQQIIGATYNRLVRYRGDAQLPEPDVAQSWEQAGTDVVFKLHEGVKWQNKPPVNGRDFTASDVVFGLERARSDDPSFIHSGDLAVVDTIEAPDDSTVRLTTKYPTAIILTMLAGYQWIPVAPEVIDQFGDIKSPEATIGTGPFIVESFAPDFGATLVRNPDYWREGLPYLDELEQLDVEDHWSQFRAGNIDIVLVPAELLPGHDSFAGFLESEGIDGYVYSEVMAASAHGHFMNTQDPVFADIRVRWAINLIMDRLPNRTYGWPIGAKPSIALGMGHLAFHLPDAEFEAMPGFGLGRRDQDVAEGLQMLAAAGFDADNPMEWRIMGWSVPQTLVGIDQLQIAVDMYKDVSGNVLRPSEQALEWGAWKQAEALHEFQMISSAYSMGVDAHDAMQKMYHSEGGRNFSQYANPDFDRMLAVEESTFDIEERISLMQDMQRFVNSPEEIANAWTGSGPFSYAALSRIQGIPMLWDSGRVDQVYVQK